TQQVSAHNSVICMEATGVYGEAITHYLASQNFPVAVEPPLKVKRAFYPHGHKNDRVDSRQIAEYAYRFFDQLRFWHPLEENIERLKHFLSLREQLVKQSVAIQNALKAYQRHILKDQSLIEIQQKHLSQVKEHIALIDGHIKGLINQNPSLHQLSLFLVSLCGIGVLLSAYMLVMTNGFQNISQHKQFAAFLGICPFEFKSGKSVHRQSHCRPFGPDYAKKLFHLAARSAATHHPEFRKYYLRKLEQGKSKSLVLNNIANKLVKISFALVRDRQSYIPGYRSINPLILQNA
ncbi:MAG: IS110 family transposase, partial [Nanoarchaeota archaeon]